MYTFVSPKKDRYSSVVVKNKSINSYGNDDVSTSVSSASSSSSSSYFALENSPVKKKLRTYRKEKNDSETFTTPSKKPYDAPMQKRDLYFALDCEMVGVGRDGVDSALARVSVVNWDNEIILDTFVKVDDDVTDYRTFVSGIRKEDIESDSAMTVDEVRIVVQSILRGKILVGHGLSNDLNALGINHPWCDLRDTATYQPLMRESTSGLFVPKKLKELALEKLGWNIQEVGKAHNPVEDAISSMEIYKLERNAWETYIMRQVHAARTLRSPERPLTTCKDSCSGQIFYQGNLSSFVYSPQHIHVMDSNDRIT